MRGFRGCLYVAPSALVVCGYRYMGFHPMLVYCRAVGAWRLARMRVRDLLDLFDDK
jgi:hypothetical protein